MSLFRRRTIAALAFSAIPVVLAVPGVAGAQDSTAAATDTVPVADSTALAVASTEGHVHTVRRGDTLWDLAHSYLGDPFLWPEIYRLNTAVVEDPHWIYPGERLALPGSAAVVAGGAGNGADDRDGGADRGTVFGFAGAPAKPVPTTRERVAARGTGALSPVRPGEVYAAPFVDREGGPARAGSIRYNVALSNVRANVDEQALLVNDEVYIAPPGGRTASVGDEFYSYTLGARLEKMGQLVVPTGVFRVERVTPGTAPVARLVRQFGRVLVGQQLLPLEAELPAPGQTAAAVENGPMATVVWLPNEPVLPSLQQYVILDVSARTGTRVGDQITLIRPRESRAGGAPLPEERIAVAQVVRVTRYGATAIVVHQKHPAIKLGTRARVTAKMP